MTLDHSCEISFLFLPNWTSTKSTKFGQINRKKKVIQSLKLSKMSVTKNVVLNLYYSMKKNWKIRMIFDILKDLKVQFLHLLRYQKDILEEWSRIKNLSMDFITSHLFWMHLWSVAQFQSYHLLGVAAAANPSKVDDWNWATDQRCI